MAGFKPTGVPGKDPASPRGRGAARFEIRQVPDGDLGNPLERSIREEGLMAGDKDIGKGEQPGKQVVLEDLRGTVLEKESGFLLVNVDGEVADMPLFQATDDGRGVKNGATAGVDEKDPFFHEREGLVVDDMAG